MVGFVVLVFFRAVSKVFIIRIMMYFVSTYLNENASGERKIQSPTLYCRPLFVQDLRNNVKFDY